jgi:thiosulfate/3-mercaptopyruvate sulfurtransferase
VLVTPAWLAEHLHDPELVPVDLRWREDGSSRSRYEAGHIAGAAFCDWTSDLVDPEHRFAFMLAPPARFAATMRRLGIHDGSVVVAYADDLGSGPFRLRWACRVYGHDQVRILDGGLERWIREGHPLERGRSDERRAEPTSAWNPRAGVRAIATADDVASAEDDPSVIVFDSRPPEQFRGEAVWFETGPVAADADGVARTPRGDLRAGHVPWARNVPSALLYRRDGTLKDPAELRELFTAAGYREGARAITYCGVGISGSALLYALERAGVADVRLYDASWDEWGRDPARPVAR